MIEITVDGVPSRRDEVVSYVFVCVCVFSKLNVKLNMESCLML